MNDDILHPAATREHAVRRPPASGIWGRLLGMSPLLLLACFYWALFAYANSMVVYYGRSIYPLLSATQTPNPYLFIHPESFLGWYNSGLEWAVTGNIVLLFYLGDTAYSIALTVLVYLNASLLRQAFRAGAMKQQHLKAAVIVLMAVLLIVAFATLMALPLLFFTTSHSTLVLQVWAANYALESNAASVLVMLLLLPAWKRVVREALSSSTAGVAA